MVDAKVSQKKNKRKQKVTPKGMLIPIFGKQSFFFNGAEFLTRYKYNVDKYGISYEYKWRCKA